ncbi:MAG: hypothetical protein ACRC4N_00055, partial [Gammaproteobacteria bacterium]
CCCSNSPGTLPAMPDDNATSMESMSSMFDTKTVGTAPTLDKACSNSTEALPQTYDNGWLDKFCMELGYHNLSFLTAPYGGSKVAIAGASARAGVDVTDGCIPTDAFKIIKATIVIIMEHVINKKPKELSWL